MENNYTIYKLTFPDGKIYIGQTNRSIEQRWNHGEGYKGQDVYVPIILYGWDNIKKEILHTNLTQEQANNLEKHYIKKLNSIKNGYNRSVGGYNNKKKIITINIEKNLNEFFDYIPELARNLNGNAFKIIFYFFTKNHSTFEISTKEIAEFLNISKQSCLDSFKELKNKNYIIENDDETYTFNILK